MKQPWNRFSRFRFAAVARQAVALLSLVFLCGRLPAQEANPNLTVRQRSPRAAEQTRTPLSSIRVAVNNVLVPVLVTDLYDRPVSNLTKESFHLYEDGVEQNINAFFSQDTPVSIGILFDASTSMKNKIAECQQAVSRFLKFSMPGDEFFLSKFADLPERLHSFTKDTQEIESLASAISPRGLTSLFDAIYLGMRDMKRARYDRKALLILSDGADNNSRYTEHEIRSKVQESDVRIFAISVQDRSSILEKLSEQSGGRAYRVRKLEELEDVAAKVSLELHNEYVLGYSPATQVQDGRYRRLKVQVVQDKVNVPVRASWRRGYYGPLD